MVTVVQHVLITYGTIFITLLCRMKNFPNIPKKQLQQVLESARRVSLILLKWLSNGLKSKTQAR